mmetsp:Transcript_5863/g.9738  ORF Transcript_5863/g.9738 Transcript_5863/m.9738 type:complete len:411 (+) Transcript_5863:111-1343(+)|eukprot:CAMPEP_0119015842 /NCGR_PEP_ID=MMETSP1176-20130426/11679_1 /TAXON_ID=265551 /ORGANISM="Synedropsis recta cf, Strain CCMP1620" /LENGTH=410 /DNA_ID=CAMNT_0006969165 /DNA_START=111 /DNA_END=1343 /DNA_ORIENTATION=+
MPIRNYSVKDEMKGEGKNGSTPPRSSAASYSSVATTPISQASEAQEQDSMATNGNVVMVPGDFVTPLSILAGISATSISAILLLCVPVPVLVALLAFFLSSGYMIYLCLMLLVRELRTIIQGGGIGAYLPASIYNQLTELTLHEWMQDTAFTMEYRHLILYFVPGINQEQLNTYVDALAPRHRRNLRRRGLGHFMGEGFMRLLMGDSQYSAAHAMGNQVRPTELLLPSSSSTVEADVGSELGSTTPEVLFSDSPDRSRAAPIFDEDRMVSRTIITVEADTQEQEREQEHLQQEESVLADAMSTMVNTYVNVSLGTVTATYATLVEMVTPYIVRTGFGATAISVGFGLFGMSFPRRTTSRHFPNSQTLWTAGFIGGFSAGGMFLFRSAVRHLATTKKADSKPTEDAKRKQS